jgi:hypothetical protein
MDLQLTNFMKSVIINPIIKVKDSNVILGGYTPIAWKTGESDEDNDEFDNDGDNYDAAKDSFIFSFTNSNDIENYILSRVKKKNVLQITKIILAHHLIVTLVLQKIFAFV